MQSYIHHCYWKVFSKDLSQAELQACRRGEALDGFRMLLNPLPLFKIIFLQIKYADIEKDKRGRPFIDDHGVHEIIQTVIFSHALKSH